MDALLRDWKGSAYGLALSLQATCTRVWQNWRKSCAPWHVLRWKWMVGLLMTNVDSRTDLVNRSTLLYFAYLLGLTIRCGSTWRSRWRNECGQESVTISASVFLCACGATYEFDTVVRGCPPSLFPSETESRHSRAWYAEISNTKSLIDHWSTLLRYTWSIILCQIPAVYRKLLRISVRALTTWPWIGHLQRSDCLTCPKP